MNARLKPIFSSLAGLALWIGFAGLAAPFFLKPVWPNYPPLQDPSVWFKFIASVSFVVYLIWGPLAWIMTRSWFFHRLVGEATPGALGAIRFLVCGRLFMKVVWEDLASLAPVPDVLRNPMGVMGLFYRLPISFERLVHSAFALTTLQVVTTILLFLGMIGFRSRWTVPLGGLGAFLIKGILRQYSFFWHQDLVAMYIIGVLSFTRCGDGWSFDRLIDIARGRPVPPANRPARTYGWARYACWVALALPYVAAGLSKLRNGGLFWWNGTSLRRMLLVDTLNPMQFDWKISLDLAVFSEKWFALLGLAAIGGEIAYGLVLVWPLARKIFPAMMALMHLGIIFLQNILFVDLLILQTIFYDWSAVRRAIGRGLCAKRGRWEIFYDGHCQICLRTMEIFRRLDLFERLRYTDFRKEAPADLSFKALEEEMHVLGPSGMLKGYDAYRSLALALPMAWPLAPFLWLPGVSTIGRLVYARVAAGRFSGSPCSGTHCQIPAHEHSTASLRTEEKKRFAFVAPLAVAGLMSVLTFCWIYQIEYYPFTAMQMYSQPFWHSQKPIVYYQVFAERGSGEVSKKAFEDAVGAYAINGRYRLLIKNYFKDETSAERCRLFLTTMARSYNKKVPAELRIRRLQIQQWICPWDDPKNGTLRFGAVIEV